MVAALGLALVVMLTPGCALLSRGAAVDVRWFTPELPSRTQAAVEMQPAPELRLGRVTSGAGLGLRIAFGSGLYEIGYYDSRRWTERPEQYVRRALDRALFEGGAFQRALGDGAPSLEVDVLDFQEITGPMTHAARVALRVVLSTDRVLLERTVAVSRAAAGTTFDSFVAAMAQALDAASREVARSVGEALALHAPAREPGPGSPD
jgi:cholesterol transport system auxiliary component